MPSVLCIAGLDPSGHSGLSADMRALSFLGIHCMPVATALTVQSENEIFELNPVSPGVIWEQLDIIFKSARPNAIKIGVVGSSEIAELLVSWLDGKGIPTVTDPVFISSSGFGFMDDALHGIYRNGIFPLSSVVTPNVHEAETISGMSIKNASDAEIACGKIYGLGPGSVLLKGGHLNEEKGTDIFYDKSGARRINAEGLDVKVRGAGCTYSSLIAGYLSIGLENYEAAKRAKCDLHRAIQINLRGKHFVIHFDEPLSPERMDICLELNHAVSCLTAMLPAELIAEAGNNVAYAIASAQGPDDICSLDSRIILKRGRPVTVGTPVFGMDSYIGRVVLAAMKKEPDMCCAMNLKCSDAVLEKAKNAGFRTGVLDSEEPSDSVSSADWSTEKVIRDIGFVPDVIFDKGSVGKEPLMIILACNPTELAGKCNAMLECD